MEPFWTDLENRFLRLHKEQASAKGNGFLHALNYDGDKWTVSGSSDSVQRQFEWTVEHAALRLGAPAGKEPMWFWLDLLKKESGYFRPLNGSSNRRRSELDSDTLCSLEREIKVSDGGVIELPCRASAEYCIRCDTQEQLKAGTSKSEDLPAGPATPPEASAKKPTDPGPRPPAPKPVSEVGGRGDSFTPRASSVPQERPSRFQKDLWPRTKVILLKAQSEFPLEEDALKLCNYVTKEMTPLLVEAVETGKMEAESVGQAYGGERDDLLGLLLICNAGRGDLGGLSDAAYRLRKEVWKSKEWFAMAEAIAKAQQSKSETTLEKPKVGARLAEPEKSANHSNSPEASAEPDLTDLPPKKQDLERYFDGLTEIQKQCVSLAWEYGLRVTEIARRMGRHHSTVQEALDAAKKRIEIAQSVEKGRKRKATKGYQQH